MKLRQKLVALALTTLPMVVNVAAAESDSQPDYDVARYHPMHFMPAIEDSSNQDCLQCHQNILDDKPLDTSPAGLETQNSLAWYQTLSTYDGEQDTFHRRHMVTDFATSVMNLNCNTCHQGNDPREEISESATDTQSGLTMRKQVDPYVCLLCHGQDNYQVMGMPSSWSESRAMFQDNCLLCHAGLKLERHKEISFLNAEAIEELGKENSDVCFGCHGGRSWYDIYFPYTAKHWPGQSEVPLGMRSKYSK